MAYGPIIDRDSYINWPGSVQQQWARSQDIRKTIPGTKRGETPYSTFSSFLSGRTVHGTASSNSYHSCSQYNGSQTVAGRVYNDYYSLAGRAQNRARQQFIQTAKEHRNASIGATIGEFGTTLDMIGNRAASLLAAARALRKGQPRKALNLLGSEPPSNWKARSKSFSDAWLEMSFGWVPLYQDIHQGMEIISSDIPTNGNIRSGGSASYEQPSVVTVNTGWLKTEISGMFRYICQYRGKAKLVNPNLDRLQALGLINPASVAWELVPFSFLVDHTIGIGNFLDSFSDEVGWEMTDVAVSAHRFCDGTEVRHSATGSQNNWTGSVRYAHAFCQLFTRVLNPSLPPHTLEYQNPFTGLSAPRAANYIALLVQQLVGR